MKCVKMSCVVRRIRADIGIELGMKGGEKYSWMGMLVHFADSALPVGSYAHSFGLEGMCQEGMIHDEESLRLFFLRDVKEGLVSVDLPLMVRAHTASLDHDAAAVRRWDEQAWALRPTRQLREAATKIGRQTWALYQKTWADDESSQITDWFPRFQSPIVTGAIFALRGVPAEGCLWVGSYQVYSALVQAALKLLPIGPSAGQRLLQEALSEIENEFPAVVAKIDDELGTFNPLWDIAASRHERASARLFIS